MTDDGSPLTTDRLLMPITPARIRRLAALARLELRPAEVEALAADLEGILGHMEALRAVEPAGVEVAGGPAAPLRPDEPGRDPLLRGPAELAPVWEEPFYRVPGVPGMGGAPPEDGEPG